MKFLFNQLYTLAQMADDFKRDMQVRAIVDDKDYVTLDALLGEYITLEEAKKRVSTKNLNTVKCIHFFNIQVNEHDEEDQEIIWEVLSGDISLEDAIEKLEDMYL